MSGNFRPFKEEAESYRKTGIPRCVLFIFARFDVTNFRMHVAAVATKMPPQEAEKVLRWR